MKLHEHIRKAIECIKQGTIGSDISDVFFPDGVPVPKEYALWDYKVSINGDKPAYAELAKDILSFFNSYGGYLFIGISETKKDECFEIAGFQRPENFVQRAQSAIQEYSSIKIDISIFEILIGGKPVSVIFVPCRPVSQVPAFLTKNSPELKPGKSLFLEKTTYFRQLDKTLQATIATQWEFLNSPRNPADMLHDVVSLTPVPVISRVIPCNLPDRNLICAHLYGREEILASLWAWIADDLEPVRLLAGAGGRGKTSIAYEFGSRFYRNAPKPYEQVLWISAKRLQFRADRNEYMELPECMYSNPMELLEALCLGTAALTKEDIGSVPQSEYTLRKMLKESLQLLPSLVIVDDIDSLQQTEQKRVFELVQQISSGACSKFLLTTRANFAFSDTQCITVGGLKGQEYHEFVNDRLSRLGLKSLKNSDIRELQKDSDGSPLWTESILRLVKQGYTLQQALKEWKSKPGEDARSAALKKELEALSRSAKRVLYVASLLQDCSRVELIEITKIGKTEFNESISELQALFLVDAPKIIENEPRFSVATSTAIAVKEQANKLVLDHKRLLTQVQMFIKNTTRESGMDAKKEIGAVVKQAMALLRVGQLKDAVDTVDAALKVRPDNPDLLMLKGRCLRESDTTEAASVFSAAHEKGQKKPLLFDMWYEVLIKQGDFVTAVDVATFAINSDLDLPTWFSSRAHANTKIGVARYGADGSIPATVSLLQKAAADYSSAVANSRSAEKQAAEYMENLISVNDAIWLIVSRGRGFEAELLAFDAINSVLKTRDYRSENVERLIETTTRLIADVDLSTDTPRARAGRSRVGDALTTIRNAAKNKCFPDVLRSEYENATSLLEKYFSGRG